MIGLSVTMMLEPTQRFGHRNWLQRQLQTYQNYVHVHVRPTLHVGPNKCKPYPDKFTDIVKVVQCSLQSHTTLSSNIHDCLYIVMSQDYSQYIAGSTPCKPVMLIASLWWFTPVVYMWIYKCTHTCTCTCMYCEQVSQAISETSCCIHIMYVQTTFSSTRSVGGCLSFRLD